MKKLLGDSQTVCVHAHTCTNLQLLDNPLYTSVCHRNTNRLSDSHRVPEAQLASYQTPGSETNMQHTGYSIPKSKKQQAHNNPKAQLSITIEPYPEPDKSSLHPHTLFLCLH